MALEVELRRIALPLRRPFRTAHGTMTTRELLLVRVVTEAGDGWGECAALDHSGYSGEDVATAHAALRDELVPALRAGAAAPSAAAVWHLPGRPAHPMAAAALEAALLDSELRAGGLSLAAHLGGTRSEVEAGVALGIPPALPELLDQVAAARAEGYRRVKLKVRPGWDVEPVAAIRDRFGDAVVLQVDANGAYSPADAGHLAELDRFDLAMIEQPLAAPSLTAHAALARAVRTPVCLDESITSAGVAAEAIALGAAAVINLKPGRMGGMLEAVRAHEACHRSGTPAWCGGMLESGLGRAANLALASLPGFTLPGDLTPPERYLAADITAPLPRRGAMMAVPTGPGAVAVDLDALEAATVSVEVLK